MLKSAAGAVPAATSPSQGHKAVQHAAKAQGNDDTESLTASATPRVLTKSLAITLESVTAMLADDDERTRGQHSCDTNVACTNATGSYTVMNWR